MVDKGMLDGIVICLIACFAYLHPAVVLIIQGQMLPIAWDWWLSLCWLLHKPLLEGTYHAHWVVIELSLTMSQVSTSFNRVGVWTQTRTEPRPRRSPIQLEACSRRLRASTFLIRYDHGRWNVTHVLLNITNVLTQVSNWSSWYEFMAVWLFGFEVFTTLGGQRANECLARGQT